MQSPELFSQIPGIFFSYFLLSLAISLIPKVFKSEGDVMLCSEKWLKTKTVAQNLQYIFIREWILLLAKNNFLQVELFILEVSLSVLDESKECFLFSSLKIM